MASDITVSSLVASTGVGIAVLTGIASSPSGQSCLSYMQAARVEFYVASTNNRAAATAYDGGLAGIAKISLSAGTFYCWARAVDPDGNFGPYYPTSATGGVSFSVPDATPGPGSITEDMLDDNAVSTRVFEAGITPVEYGNVLPTSGNYVGRTFLLTTTGKLYRYFGGWTSAVPTSDLSGLVPGSQISSYSITAAQLASLSITSDKIVAGAVSAAKMSVSSLSAISANIGTVTSGLLQGATFQTGASGQRIVMGPDNALKVYASSGSTVARFGTTSSGISPPISVNSDGPAAFLQASVIAAGVACTNSGGGVVIHGSSSSTGSNAHAFRGQAVSAGHGIVGVSHGGGGHAFYAESGGYAPFTGAHDGLLAKDHELDVGDFLVDRRVVARDGVSDTLTEVVASAEVKQKGAVGVLASRQEFLASSRISGLPGNEETPVKRHLSENYDRVSINSVGEGQMNVCGRGGNIETGDFICASDLPGKGQRQNDDDGRVDDLLRRCTVAKARENVDFDNPDQVKRVAVIYLCG